MCQLPKWCLPLAATLLAITTTTARSSLWAEDVAGPVMKADLAEWLKTTGAESTKRKREWEVEDLAHSLDAAKKGVIDSSYPEVQRAGIGNSKFSNDRYWFKTSESKAKHVKKLEVDLAAAKAQLDSKQPIPPDLRVDKMKVGAVGKLRCLRDTFDKEIASRTARVVQVIDESNMLCQMGETLFWLEGSTDRVVDDHMFDVGDLCYEATGTTRYGTRTVFKVKRLDLEPKDP